MALDNTFKGNNFHYCLNYLQWLLSTIQLNYACVYTDSHVATDAPQLTMGLHPDKP